MSGLFRNVSEEDKNAAIRVIIEHAVPRPDFFLMLTLSVSMAAFGILLDSLVILVGSMLIAPLLFPMFSMALGIIIADENLIKNSAYTILKSVCYAVGAGFVIGFLFSGHSVSNTLLTVADVGASYSLIYAVVAAIAGFAGAFAMMKPYLNATLPGVAVSVALVPPLAAAGVGLSLFNWAVFSNALLLFLVNIIGIIFSAMIVFALFHFAVKKTVAREAVKKEEKIIAKEESGGERKAPAA